MKILYATDLHGDMYRYKALAKEAKARAVDVVINGGDLSSVDVNNLLRQGNFFKCGFKEHLEVFEKAGIYYVFMPGNNDLQIFDQLLEEMCGKMQYAKFANQRVVEVGGYEIIGYPNIPDYPFKIKDRTRRDSDNFKMREQIDDPIISDPEKGIVKVDDLEKLLFSRPTIEQELKSLPAPKNMKKCIYCTHVPPSNLGLDRCDEICTEGSDAVFRFIHDNQPFMTLHGHVHGSPIVSGRWFGTIGNTVAIQPGQPDDQFVYVVIDTSTMAKERFVL